MPARPGRGRLSRGARGVGPAASSAPHRARYPGVGPAPRAGARRRHPVGGRGRAGRRRPADARRRLPDSRHGRRGGRGAVGVPQPVRGQRGEALLERRRQAAGRLGGRDRGATRASTPESRGRPARGSGGCARSPEPSAATWRASGRPCRRASISRGSRSSSTARTARPTVSLRACSGRSGPRWTRSACGRPGRTSTAAWERSIRKGSRRASARRRGRSASRSTATATASSWSTSPAPPGTATTSWRPAPGRSWRVARSRAGSLSRP